MHMQHSNANTIKGRKKAAELHQITKLQTGNFSDSKERATFKNSMTFAFQRFN